MSKLLLGVILLLALAAPTIAGDPPPPPAAKPPVAKSEVIAEIVEADTAYYYRFHSWRPVASSDLAGGSLSPAR